MKPYDIITRTNFMRNQGYSIDHITMNPDVWEELVTTYPKMCFKTESNLGEIRLGETVLEVKKRVKPYAGDAYEIEDALDQSVYLVSSGSEILINELLP